MKTSRKAYMVVVQYECSKMVHDVLPFTNMHAAMMCADQYRKRPGCGYTAQLWVRNMNDGRCSLSGV